MPDHKANAFTEFEHFERHKMLHKYLDELVADWISNTKNYKLSTAPVIELMDWSSKQIEENEWKK